ncbi:hypothetical protein DLM75_07425 [Leptospira stimsonii]|uniref:Uncharacterized protein n=1 Tax=Leptospira stimsonii TaxID=2202203 RepID=A0A396ZGU5_9LEPT|nr:hypothetical protein DLM75_07425 [Leptospira stimsonii]
MILERIRNYPLCEMALIVPKKFYKKNLETDLKSVNKENWKGSRLKKNEAEITSPAKVNYKILMFSN